MRAYILLKVNPNDTARLMQELKEVQHITQASFIHGPYDCILEIHAKDFEGVNDVVNCVRGLNGVTDTLTCFVIQSWQHAPA